MTNLADIASELREYKGSLTLEDTSVGALRLIKSCSSNYVWPDVETEDDSTTNAGVLLITAAGAVGKSAAAEALAGTLNWPLVDAGRAQVGSFSVTGLLYDALGLSSTYIPALGNGEAGIVIDALDEAHLKAGTSNFYEFLENVRRITRGSLEGPKVILLSRPDTAVLVKLYFESTSTPLANYILKFFDHTRSCEYIDSQLRQLHTKHPDRNYSIAQRYPIPFAHLRDMRMKEIAEALLSKQAQDLKSTWNEVQEFLGYAPVLSVLSEFLAVANPHAETAKNLAQVGGARGILIQIIDDILLREQVKFQAQVSAKLRAQMAPEDEWHSPQECYSPHEQSLRLVAKFFGQELAIGVPASLPESLRSAYENDASQFLADHPFVSGTEAINVVFSDYVIAMALVDPACSAAFRSNPMSSTLEVGPFFHLFANQLAPKSEDGMADVPDAILAKLLTSYRKAQVNPDRSVFIYSNHDDYAVLLLTGDIALKHSMIEFEFNDTTGVLEFPKQIARGHIVSNGGIVLGEHGNRFFMGPGVSINASAVEINANILTVDSAPRRSRANPSIIVANEIRVTANLTVESVDHGLAIFGECSWPALRKYATEKPSIKRVPQADYVHLRALLKAFRQGAGHAPSVFEELMDQRIVKATQVRQFLLSRLMKLGFVTKNSRHYYLDTSKLAKEGIDWVTFVNGEPNEKIMKFLTDLTGE